MTIGILDSGIGGTSIQKTLEKKFPEHNYLYLADKANFPYSTKSTKELQQLAKKNVTDLINQGAELIVLACNTLTVATIDILRREFPDTPFIGTVPAIKLAAETLPPNSSIMIIATEHTAKSSYLLDLIKKHAANQQVTIIGSTDLVTAIESKDSEDVTESLKQIDDILDQKAFDGIVIGCTHFSFIEKELQKQFGSEVQLFDSLEGIAKQVGKYLKQRV